MFARTLWFTLILSSVMLVSCGDDAGLRVMNVSEELQPGTTLHTVVVEYRRYGPAADIYAQYFPEYGPETLRHETWMEFDDDGKLVSARSESRREDGSIYRRTRLEGTDIVVEDEHGVEQNRWKAAIGDDMIVDSVKAAYRRAIEKTVAALDEHPDAPTVVLRNMKVRVIEDRREFTRTLGPASANSYSAPYVYDLEPVVETRRSYVALDGSVGYRSEVAVIGRDGAETVVESTDHLVVEVLPN